MRLSRGSVERQFAKIVAARILESAQAEFWQYRIEVIENVGLDLFERGPDRCVGETIDLERQTFGRRVHLTHQQRHTLVHAGMVAKIIFYIGPKRAYIGELTPVDRIVGAVAQLLVPFGDFLAFFGRYSASQSTVPSLARSSSDRNRMVF